ncbi:hypothetical protein T492DRAFT_1003817 [Pavlovales sp. CCMP2436]|nr:hypothetical protein T492DRAFT_1003817 [Pavlovales sp. CCMP2436]
MAIGQGSQREAHAGQDSQRERGEPCAGQGSRRERGEPCAGQGSPRARGEPPGELARWAPGRVPPGHSPFSWSGGGHWAPAGHSAFSWTGAPQFTSVVPSTATVRASRSTQTDAPRPVADPLSGTARHPAYDPSASPGSRAEPGLVRLKATCEYDGSTLGGWMIQANPEESVQKTRRETDPRRGESLYAWRWLHFATRGVHENEPLVPRSAIGPDQLANKNYAIFIALEGAVALIIKLLWI